MTTTWPTHRRALAATALMTLVALLCAACGAAQHPRATVRSCNGASVLCSRPINDVIFPGTHNSFAASEQPGWYFASQTYAIPRQLHDGVRALLIDIHDGVYDAATGRVRTDLARRAALIATVLLRVVAASGGLRVADRAAGGVGLGTLKGKPEPYLCHTLCELGAEPLDRELKAIATFLDGHPDQVLVVIVEDYVSPSTIEQAFITAGSFDTW